MMMSKPDWFDCIEDIIVRCRSTRCRQPERQLVSVTIPPSARHAASRRSVDERLAALDSYDVLDTPAEAGFDDIVVLATQICETPVALISLQDRHRNWFKARVGFALSETPLDQSVCAHALDAGDMLVIPDLAADPRTQSNPLVTGEPFIRFYAGAMLETADGLPIGTLCVIDHQPRPHGLRPDQAAALQALARQVMAQLELRRFAQAERAGRQEVQSRKARYEAVFDSAIDYAIIVLDRDGVIVDWNAGATRILGWKRTEVCGRDLSCFFTPEDRVANIPQQEMDNARAHGRGMDERWHIRKNGERFWAAGEMMPLRAATGELEGYVKILRDRTEHRMAEQRLLKSEERLELLFKASGAIGWWDWDIPEDRLIGNAQFARMYSVDPDLAMSGAPIAAYLNGVYPDDRAWIGEKIQAALKAGGDFSEEYRVQARDGEVTWLLARGRCFLNEAGQPRRFPGVAIDITARKAAEARREAMVDLGNRLRDETSIERMAFAAAEVLGRTLNVDRAGYGTVDAARETIRVDRHWNAPGMADVAGVHHFRDYGSFIDDLKQGRPVLVSDVTCDPRTEANAEALQALNIRSLLNVPVREHGTFVAVLFVHASHLRIWHGEELIFVLNIADRVRAAIERVKAEERQRLLNQELSHRLKNILAMVQAIASQTLRTAPDLETAQHSLSARMVALGKAHDLLLKGRQEAADIRDLIEGALAMHDQAQAFQLSGPSLQVGSRAALSLALMLHELSTNAAKYGALSCPEGKVTIDWGTVTGAEHPQVWLKWREQGGPPVSPPSRRGFGSRLIERGLAGQIGGRVALDYHPEGLICTLEAPLAAFTEEELHPQRTIAP